MCQTHIEYITEGSLNLCLFITQQVISKLTRYGTDYFDTSDSDAEASSIFLGRCAYNQNGKVVGTMANNGQLNYTPSDEAQTIPAGYTSGGTVGAVDITTLDDYKICDALADAILSSSAVIIPSTPILQLVGKLNNGSGYSSDISYWKNLINNTNVVVSNGGWDNNALVFNGSNTEFNSGVAQSTLSGGYTMALRIKPDRWENNNGLIGLHYSANNGICGLQYYASKISYQHYNNGGVLNLTVSDIPVNNWNVIIITYNSSTGLIKVIVNGVLKGSATALLNPNGDVIIGRAGNLTEAARYFKGNMSHLIIYDKVLTDSEISELNNYIQYTI